jgi:hypothetical protein
MRHLGFIAALIAGVVIGMPLGTLATPYVVADFQQWCSTR